MNPLQPLQTHLALVAILMLLPPAFLRAATSITPTNHFAYGANIGWIEARGDVANGAVIGEYVCSGYLWAANVGWISLGGGVPANGIRYQNNSASDWGVNHDGLGNLRGYAYGANIGWIAFETNGAPKVDLATGKLSGYAYSANCGWISLSNAHAHVQTAYLAPGADTDGDGIADGWELTYTNTLTAFTAATDTDRDGATDLQEYLADTSPLDAGDRLRITSFRRGLPGNPTRCEMTWSSKPSRLYGMDYRTAFDTNAWAEWVVFPWPGVNNSAWDDFGAQRFYRIKALRPLRP